MKYILLSIFLGFGAFNFQQFEMPGMEVHLSRTTNDQLRISGWVETEGWVAIGFNNQAGMTGADLKMLALTADGPMIDDRKTLSPGHYPSDKDLGGQINIDLEKLQYKAGKTHFAFTIPLRSADVNDIDLKTNKDLWIILAYSAEKDFLHHSRLRNHFKFSFTE